MTSNWSAAIGLISTALYIPIALADSTDARCDIYPKGSDRLEKMVPCTFSQRQGAVGITLQDGVRYDLVPYGESPGNYRDQQGRPAYRQSGLGNQGLIFRLDEVSIYVYWDTSALNPSDKDSPTAPFSTKDYDATTLLPCKASPQADFTSCPAGIQRMEDSQASITVKGPSGETFTINFMKDYVNATNHEVTARLVGDTWTVTLENGEVYQVPMAAIEGG